MSGSEFERLVSARKLDAKPVHVEATATEREALAQRFGLVAIHRLEADVELAPDKEAVVAQGRISADIVQTCGISGDDLAASIDEPVTLRFVPARKIEEEEIELEEEDLDEIEFEGDRFDLGEAIAQSLALAIDPYAVGPEAARVREEAGLNEGLKGPLAEALKALKKD